MEKKGEAVASAAVGDTTSMEIEHAHRAMEAVSVVLAAIVPRSTESLGMSPALQDGRVNGNRDVLAEMLLALEPTAGAPRLPATEEEMACGNHVMAIIEAPADMMTMAEVEEGVPVIAATMLT